METFDPRVLDQPGTVFLDSSKPGDDAGFSLLFSDPVDIVQTPNIQEVPQLLKKIDHAAQEGMYVGGYLAYEAAYALTRTTDLPKRDTTLAWFGIYEKPSRWSFADVLDGWSTYRAEEASAIGSIRLEIQEETYLNAIRAIKSLIREGDVYQINFTTHAAFEMSCDPLALYQRLRTQQPVPFSAFVRTDEQRLLSLSPELFFHRKADHVRTKPMKGTIKRGRTIKEDAYLQEKLATDEKSQAENLMIVDLLRNDLSRMCRPGSVTVPELFSVEAFESVHQMTSTVEGTLSRDISYSEIFEALFPCGSVTGAPKLRAMRRISELEARARGAYCGTIGYISPKDEAVFNVAIRTIELRDGAGRMGTGSGIVWDSDPAEEFDETKLKARFLNEALRVNAPTQPPKLIETMRWANGSIPLKERHIERLGASAKWFSYPFEAEWAYEAIRETSSSIQAEIDQKIRLTLDAAGRLEITASDVEPLPDPLKLTFWSGRVNPSNSYLYHKTTRRATYQNAYEEAQRGGYDEALLLNQEGYVTEGTRTNLFIRIGNTWLTPRLSCGLLPGVYRSYLLTTLADVEESEITRADVCAADEVICCNALRGMVPAIVATTT